MSKSLLKSIAETKPSTNTHGTKSSALLSKSSVMWQFTTFAELSVYQIYNIIQAREQVFVKDQQCSYIDADGLDFEAMHLSAYQEDVNSQSSEAHSIQNLTPQLLAYCRILAPTTRKNYPRIGRVLVLADYRGYGLARQLMIRAIEYCHERFSKQSIHISAQTYLIDFYQSLDFICDGAVYSEDGIEHIHMILTQPSTSTV